MSWVGQTRSSSAGDVSRGLSDDGRDEPAQQICVGCGLCCDGTLFSHLTTLDDNDLGLPLRMRGVQIIVEADPPVFALPCPAVAHGRCTIYDQHRPRACHDFNCDLVDAVAGKTMSPAEARSIIAGTITLRDEVRAGRAGEPELRRRVETFFRRAT